MQASTDSAKLSVLGEALGALGDKLSCRETAECRLGKFERSAVRRGGGENRPDVDRGDDAHEASRRCRCGHDAGGSSPSDCRACYAVCSRLHPPLAFCGADRARRAPRPVFKIPEATNQTGIGRTPEVACLHWRGQGDGAGRTGNEDRRAIPRRPVTRGRAGFKSELLSVDYQAFMAPGTVRGYQSV